MIKTTKLHTLKADCRGFMHSDCLYSSCNSTNFPVPIPQYKAVYYMYLRGLVIITASNIECLAFPPLSFPPTHPTLPAVLTYYQLVLTVMQSVCWSLLENITITLQGCPIR